MPGSRSDFDRRLEAIDGKVIELFALAAEDLPLAGQALLAPDVMVSGSWHAVISGC
jgi:hypothetical protein